MLYGLETVSLRKRQESELEVAELKMLRFSLGVTRLDRIRNKYIRGTAHVGRLGDKVREARLRWFGHVQRRENLAKAASVHLSPGSSAPTSPSVPWQGPPPSSGSPLACSSLFLGPCLPPRQHSLGDSHQGRSTLSGIRGDSPPPPRDVEALGLAPEGDQFLEAGLSSEVVETLLNAKAPTTRKLYALKWRLFSLWCAQHEQDPVYCLVGTVLGFLQSRISRGLFRSTLKVYVASIAANHTLVLGATL
ncbi:hypothetical protein QTP86_010323, partial [Hemibagrus guttatus]